MKRITSFALAAVLVCVLGIGAKAGDIGTPGKTSPGTGTGDTSTNLEPATDMTDEIMLELLLAVTSLM